MRLPRTLRVAAAMALIVAVGGCRGSGGGEPVSFRTQDGFLLEGRVFGEGDHGVVLAHMFPSDQSSWFDFAEVLASEGYLALTFNFRGYGGSEGTKKIESIHRDVLAAIDLLREDRSVSTIVLVGASMGGTASLVAASESDVGGIATLSAPAEFEGLNAASAITRVEESMLFIAAVEDGAAAESAEALTKATLGVADLQLISGDEHGTDMLDGPEGEKVRRLLLEFVAGARG